MTFQKFSESLSQEAPPADLSIYLTSLWWDGKGDWEQSHEVIQEVENNDAAWIHAYLHRKEGDTWNADYWYRRAGKTRPSVSLNEEWKNLVNTFLNRN